MGKLAIVSDLHIDINELDESDWSDMLEQLIEKKVDHLHIAGDIANTKEQALRWINFMNASIPTTFHWGNHEMPELSEQEIEQENDSRFLNFRMHHLSANVWLLGVNGWYDYSFAEPLKRDFSRLKQLAWYDRFIQRPLPDPQLMAYLAQKLRAVLLKVPSEITVIMSTHFVPHAQFIRQYKEPYQKWNQINAYLGSPLFSQVAEEFPQVKHIVFGHAHRRMETQKIRGINYSSRPLGYYYEWRTTFDWIKENETKSLESMPQVKRFLADNKEQFLNEKKLFLKKEWSDAQTIIEYE